VTKKNVGDQIERGEANAATIQFETRMGDGRYGKKEKLQNLLGGPGLWEIFVIFNGIEEEGPEGDEGFKEKRKEFGPSTKT